MSNLVIVRPWLDPLVDGDGHDPRSRYVEMFWLGVLGPTATWLLRRLASGLERSPEGYELDLATTAQSMGLSWIDGRTTPFSRALRRCTMFGVAHSISGGIAVRRRVPQVSTRHLQRMPPELQAAHAEWARATVRIDDLTRAHRLATAMAELGDDPDVIEHHLVAVGVGHAVAATVADHASRFTAAE